MDEESVTIANLKARLATEEKRRRAEEEKWRAAEASLDAITHRTIFDEYLKLF
jgi:hypothetical protein